MIWCRHCTTGFAYTLRLEKCPCCDRSAHWLDESPVPLRAYILTRNDWHFLKAQKIDPEQPEPDFTLAR